MTRFAVFHRMDDPNDPSRHDCPTEDKFQAAILDRAREWLGRQEPVHQARFCEHGSYVGFERSLAYLCPQCPES